MRKAILLVVILLNTINISAKGNKPFYDPDTKHEIGAGIGYFTFANILDSPNIFSCEDDDKPIEKEFSYTPAINVHYYYKLHRRVKLGMDITWQKNKTDIVFSTSYYNNYINYLTKNLEDTHGTIYEEYIQKELEFYKNNYDQWQEECGTKTYNHLILVPQIKLTLVSREHFSLYQRYGIGLNLGFIKDLNDEKYTEVCPVPCVALLGLEFGGKKLRGYFETIELSAQGLLHAGIKYDF